MQESIRRLVVIVVLSVMLTSCQWSENRRLDRAVDTDEILGAWTLSSEGVADLRSSGIELKEPPARHTIQFKGDGSCEFNTLLPSAIRAERAANLVSSPCHWELTAGRNPLLTIELLNTEERVTYRFVEARGLRIWQYIGDPDAWKYLEYSKNGN